jgi:predicted SAM-dependent methyltransferase
MVKVTYTRGGLACLHIWREGEEYFRQKSEKFLDEWTNVMFVAVPSRPVNNIYYVDLSKEPLDFADNTFDGVDAYHVLEHLTPREGATFVAEIFRVLKPNGVCRVSVPDLENICREYLRDLRIASEEPTSQNLQRYRWSVMAIFEQMVREKPGGMMLEALRCGNYDREHIEQKFSDVFRPIIDDPKHAPTRLERRTFRSRLNRLRPKVVYLGLRRRYREYKARFYRHPGASKERVRWMYDRVSLTLLMQDAGFVQIEQQDHKRSNIPEWGQYNFDCSNFADRPIDPSVYVEGRKPDSY